MSNIEKLTEALRRTPNDKNWKSFSKNLKKSGIEYYKIIFANEGKLNRMQDITKSIVELYDSKYRLITTVPLFIKTGKKVDGATSYLIGLSVLNGDQK